MARKHKNKNRRKRKDEDDDEENFYDGKRMDDKDEEDDDEDFSSSRRKRKVKKSKKDNKKRKPNKYEYDEDEESEDEDNYNNDNNASKNNWVDVTAPTTGNKLEEGTLYDPALHRQRKSRASIAFNQVSYNHEGLGEDFEDTPWVPPSVELARKYRSENILKGGNARLIDVDLTKEQECGNGLPLFFTFMQTMWITFFIMTLLSIPSLLLTTNSANVNVADRDSLGLYKYTIGNFGFSKDDPNFLKLSSCDSDQYKNSTCVALLGTKYTLETAALIITWFEFAQIIVYFGAFFYLLYVSSRLTKSAAGRDCAVSDYAVWVTNIPADTTIERLIAHFSNLYQLGVPDWRKRPPLYGAQVVTDYSNTDIDIHYNTWVAEATIYKKLGNYLRAFKEEIHVIDELKTSRAYMKMYKADTMHTGGPNSKKYHKWETQMLRLGGELDSLTEQLMYYHKKKGDSHNHLNQTIKDLNKLNSKGSSPVKPNQSALVPSAGPQRKSSISDTLEAEPFCAFVVFNYCESMARCIEDYIGYSRFPWNLCYPAQLKFRGERVTVSRAPEPDEIIWENLEIPYRKKFWARVGSFVISFILILIGFAILLQAAGYQTKVKKATPNLGLCRKEIPSLYFQTTTWPAAITPVLVRPSNNKDSLGLTRTQYDNKCLAVVPNSYYVYYSDNGDLKKPIGKYDVSACTTSSVNPSTHHGVCPATNQTTFCPCFSNSVNTPCQTIGCYTPSRYDFCGTFQALDLSGCYCSATLRHILKFTFTIEGLAYSFGNLFGGKITPKKDPCNAFFKNYIIAQSLIYIAAFASTIVNMLLKKFIEVSTKYEYYNTTDILTGNIIKKVFVVTFFNMAVVVLLAFGYYGGGGNIKKQTNILEGDYVDFTPAWYSQVGTFLIITFVLNAVSPWSVNLPKFFIYRPLRLRFLLPKVEAMKSHQIACQAQLNKLLTGRPFDTSIHYAQLLALLFLGMMYAPGIPLMTPLLCIVFGLYHYFNKLLLLRHYHRPPHMGTGAFYIVFNLLPYAAFIRLAIAVWMFGNNAIFPSGIATLGFAGYKSADPSDAADLYKQYLEDHKNDKTATFIIVSKAVRSNCLPIFVLLCIVLAIKILHKITEYLPLYYIAENLGYLYANIAKCFGKKEEYVGKVDEEGFVHATDLVRLNHPFRREMAAYTNVYIKYIKPAAISITSTWERLVHDYCTRPFALKPGEEHAGWALVEQDEWIVKIKKWIEDVNLNGASIRQGTYKRTYEVVADHGCFSYALDRIPGYQTAIKGLKENINDYNIEKAEAGDRRGKYDTQENIVERFMKEKHKKEMEIQERLAKEAAGLTVKDKPSKSAFGSSNKIAPSDEDRYAQASLDAKKSLARRALEDEEDDEEDDEDDDERGQDQRKVSKAQARKSVSDIDEDEEEEEEEEDFNRGVPGLI